MGHRANEQILRVRERGKLRQCLTCKWFPSMDVDFVKKSTNSLGSQLTAYSARNKLCRRRALRCLPGRRKRFQTRAARKLCQLVNLCGAGVSVGNDSQCDAGAGSVFAFVGRDPELAMAEPSDHPMALAMQWVGRIFAAALMMSLPGIGGQWLDRHWKTGFLGPAGFLLGLTAGMAYLIAATRQTDLKRRKRRVQSESDSDEKPDH
jgi:hypothetical protein